MTFVAPKSTFILSENLFWLKFSLFAFHWTHKGFRQKVFNANKAMEPKFDAPLSANLQGTFQTEMPPLPRMCHAKLFNKERAQSLYVTKGSLTDILLSA